MFEHVERCLLLFTPCEHCVLAQQVVEGLCQCPKVFDEIAIEASQAQHTPHFCFVFGSAHLLNGLHLGWVWAFGVCCDDKSQVLSLWLCKVALGHLGLQVVLLHATQHLLQLLHVLLPRLAVHQDVVNEHHHTVVHHVGKDVCHGSLEGGWCI